MVLIIFDTYTNDKLVMLRLAAASSLYNILLRVLLMNSLGCSSSSTASSTAAVSVKRKLVEKRFPPCFVFIHHPLAYIDDVGSHLYNKLLPTPFLLSATTCSLRWRKLTRGSGRGTRSLP